MGAADSVTTMPLDAIRGGGHVDRPQLCAAGTLELSERVAPRVVNIVPLPRGANSATIDARDGRRFIIEDAAAIVAESNAELERQRGPHPVDKDHSMLSWWTPGGPALGWATKYELRDDGIYAHTDWLPEGAELITSQRYRYTSCNVYCAKTNVQRELDDWGWPVEVYDLKMLRFAGYTLTNIPALETHALAQENDEMKKEILQALGLAETATPEDVVRSIQQMSRQVERLSGKRDVDLTHYVPRADHDAVVTQLADARAKLEAVEAEKLKAEHDALIKEALGAGKITPATEAEWREFLATDGGPERFKKIMAKTPEIAGKTRIREQAPANASGNFGLTQAELHACEVAGMSPEKFAAEKAERAKQRAK